MNRDDARLIMNKLEVLVACSEPDAPARINGVIYKFTIRELTDLVTMAVMKWEKGGGT